MVEPVVTESEKLVTRFLAGRDAALREELVLQFVPLVHYVLGRLGFNQEMGSDYEDLISQGLLGLIDAVDHYNPGFGTQFRTYAVVRVRGKILDYLRTMDWLSRTERRRSRQVQKGIADFWLKNQRAPSDKEIADHLSVDVEQVQKALVDASRVIVSLDMVHDSDDDDDEQSLHELVADEAQQNPFDIVYQEETMAQLAQAIHGLEQREQLVLTLYYYEKLTFKEIGHVLDLTESRVCQLHSRAITLLRADMQQEAPVANKVARKIERKYSSSKSQSIVDRKG